MFVLLIVKMFSDTFAKAITTLNKRFEIKEKTVSLNIFGVLTKNQSLLKTLNVTRLAYSVHFPSFRHNLFTEI